MPMGRRGHTWHQESSGSSVPGHISSLVKGDTETTEVILYDIGLSLPASHMRVELEDPAQAEVADVGVCGVELLRLLGDLANDAQDASKCATIKVFQSLDISGHVSEP